MIPVKISLTSTVLLRAELERFKKINFSVQCTFTEYQRILDVERKDIEV